MKRILITAFALGFSMLAIGGVMAQLPDDNQQQPAPPGLPQSARPGNLKLDAVDRNAPAFESDAPKLAAPKMVRSQEGGAFALAPSIVGSLPTPAYGYIHQFGAFQVTKTTAEGMFMLSATLPFPDGRRTVDFYHASLSYVGKYVEPGTGISGYLYVTDIGPPVNDKRYVLFGDRNLSIQDPNSNGVRWMVYYNGQGVRVYHNTARFYMP
jgi:hypothetical protein